VSDPVASRAIVHELIDDKRHHRRQSGCAHRVVHLVYMLPKSTLVSIEVLKYVVEEVISQMKAPQQRCVPIVHELSKAKVGKQVLLPVLRQGEGVSGGFAILLAPGRQEIVETDCIKDEVWL
jgi:hypothetical protein